MILQEMILQVSLFCCHPMSPRARQAAQVVWVVCSGETSALLVAGAACSGWTITHLLNLVICMAGHIQLFY